MHLQENVLFAAMLTLQRINAHSKLLHVVYFQPAVEKNIQHYVESTIIKWVWIYHSYSMKPFLDVVAWNARMQTPVQSSPMLQQNCSICMMLTSLQSLSPPH